jgi:hypothetical protein
MDLISYQACGSLVVEWWILHVNKFQIIYDRYFIKRLIVFWGATLLPGSTVALSFGA